MFLFQISIKKMGGKVRNKENIKISMQSISSPNCAQSQKGNNLGTMYGLQYVLCPRSINQRFLFYKYHYSKFFKLGWSKRLGTKLQNEGI